MSEDEKKYRIVLPEAEETGKYVNAVSVHVNSNEVVLDMAYNLPKVSSDEAAIKIVSRLNMTHKTAESFLHVLSNAILDWKNKQKK